MITSGGGKANHRALAARSANFLMFFTDCGKLLQSAGGSGPIIDVTRLSLGPNDRQIGRKTGQLTRTGDLTHNHSALSVKGISSTTRRLLDEIVGDMQSFALSLEHVHVLNRKYFLRKYHSHPEKLERNKHHSPIVEGPR